MNNMNKQQLFAFITEVSFALDDISLYLDTHPECPKALAAYSNYKAMRQQAVREYTTAYGPLNRYQVMMTIILTGLTNLGHGKGSVVVKCGSMKKDYSFR